MIESSHLRRPLAPFRLAALVLVNALDDLHEVVGGVGGEGVAARVEAEGGPTRNLQREADVARRRVEELRVPVSVRRHRRGERDAAAAEGDLQGPDSTSL